MNVDEKIEQILDSIRKVAFYVGHGKYNDHMSEKEVNILKAKFEKILEIENDLKDSDSLKKQEIYKKLEIFTSFSIKDFIDYEV